MTSPRISSDIEKAVTLLRSGGLVAFPTETVYGLGADARNVSAIRRIFEVKNRPVNHPLIVHISPKEPLERWTATVSDSARCLAAKFWPGPLTLILPKASSVPPELTGGQDSIGLRVPAHPLALKLLESFGGGIAAPSANRFGCVSPTTARHVEHDLGDAVDLILDGGSCAVGVESTIVNLTETEPSILRPGGVSREAIERCLGCCVPVQAHADIRVSGSLPSHYAPRAEVRVVAAPEFDTVAATLRAQGKKVVCIEPDAHTLYAAMRAADQQGADIILSTLPAEAGLGLAVADRLRRASASAPHEAR